MLRGIQMMVSIKNTTAKIVLEISDDSVPTCPSASSVKGEAGSKRRLFHRLVGLHSMQFHGYKVNHDETLACLLRKLPTV